MQSLKRGPGEDWNSTKKRSGFGEFKAYTENQLREAVGTRPRIQFSVRRCLTGPQGLRKASPASRPRSGTGAQRWATRSARAVSAPAQCTPQAAPGRSPRRSAPPVSTHATERGSPRGRTDS